MSYTRDEQAFLETSKQIRDILKNSSLDDSGKRSLLNQIVNDACNGNRTAHLTQATTHLVNAGFAVDNPIFDLLYDAPLNS